MKKKIRQKYFIIGYTWFTLIDISFYAIFAQKFGNVHFLIRFKQKCYLQQIVGMTASLVVERAETTGNAIDRIKTLMAHMDAEELSVVRVHTKELSEHVIATEQGIK